MKSIKRFNNAAEIFDEYGPNITKKERAFFENEIDYSDIAIYVVDDESVIICDSINGSVCNEMSLENFEFESFDFYAKETWIY